MTIAPLPDADSTLAPGQVLANRYRLVRLVDRGGMTEVWEAHDDILTRSVAVKVLHARLADDESFRLRFRRDAIAAARLAHPNVVATFDTGTDGDTAFIVMELVRGYSLRQLLAEEGHLDPVGAVRIAVQVARALEHAHRAGLVHRDVKPANILLCDDAFGTRQVKVTDFGIAKPAVEGADDDAERTDVYALGVVLYEMLSGRAPFEAELQTAVQHDHGEPPRLRRLRNRIPRQLDAVVMKALAKDRDQRFQSASELRAALENIDFKVDDDAEPMIFRERTPPRGVPRTVPRPASRSPVTLVVVGLLIAAGVAVTALILGQTSDDDGPPAGGGSTATTLRIVGVTSFDPQGDGSENERQTSLAADGRADTAWESELYRSRPFGRFNKSGVGLVLRIESTRALERLQVTSSTEGWSAHVYVAREPQRNLEAWGEAVDVRTDIDGPGTTFDLRGRRGAAVLLWITDTGTKNRASVAELSLSAR